MLQHVIFLSDAALDAFHDGRKQIELRIAYRRQPWLRARAGGAVLLKRVAAEVELAGEIIAIDSFDRGSPPGALEAFIRRWGPENDYLLSKPDARYGAAIEIGKLRPATFPADRTPRGARAGWVTLDPAPSLARCVPSASH